MKCTKIYYIFIQPVQSQLVGLAKGASVGGMLGCVLLVAGMAAMLIAGQMHLPFLFWPCQKENAGVPPRERPPVGAGSSRTAAHLVSPAESSTPAAERPKKRRLPPPPFVYASASPRPSRARTASLSPGTSSTSTRYCSSFSTGTPSSWALRSLEPAASPATTALVFLDTDPDTLAPRASSFSPASLREADSSSPVRTRSSPPAGPPPAGRCSPC